MPPDNGFPIWYGLARHCVELLHAIEHDSEPSSETLSGVLQSLENCGLSPRALFGISGDIRNAEAIQKALGVRVSVEPVHFERGSEFHFLTYTLFCALHSVTLLGLTLTQSLPPHGQGQGASAKYICPRGS